MDKITHDDVINGKAGRITATIDGKVYNLANVTELTATITVDKLDKEPIGFSTSGSMTHFYNTSMWDEIMYQFTKYGKTTYFDILVTNEDPRSRIGKKTVKLNGCTLDNLDIAIINTGEEMLNSRTNFTFQDFDILDKFDEYQD